MKKTIIGLVITAIIFIVGIITFCSSIYTINVNESAIILRLGKINYVDNRPGLHFHAPFIESTTMIYTGDIFEGLK